MLIQNNNRGCSERGIPFSRPWGGARKRVFGKAGEGSLSGNVLGKRLRKGSREKCLGAGPWERLSQKPFGESVSRKTSGNAFEGRVSRNRIGKAPWNVVRDILSESSSEKCLGDAVRGRFSEGHRENRFGRVFREDFQKNILKKVPCLPAVNLFEKTLGRMNSATPGKGVFPRLSFTLPGRPVSAFLK